MPPESNVESTLVWFTASDDKNTKYWTDEIDTFLQSKYYLIKDSFELNSLITNPFFTQAYHHQDEDDNKGNRVDCDFGSSPPEGKVCRVDVTMFAPCTTENRYNYPKGSPCVFLKLNKVIIFRILKCLKFFIQLLLFRSSTGFHSITMQQAHSQ